MKKRKLLIQTARLTAILYVIFVVACDMLTAGFGRVQNVDSVYRNSSSVSITVSNKSTILGKNSNIKDLYARTVDGSSHRIKLYFDTSHYSFDKVFGFYSVKLSNSEEYYYQAATSNTALSDSSQPGLYYQNEQWTVVTKADVSSISSLQVQMVHNTNGNTVYTAYSEGYTDSRNIGDVCYLEQSKLSSAFSSSDSTTLEFRVDYYDYNGAEKVAYYDTSNSRFDFSMLDFTMKGKDEQNGKYEYDVYMGNVKFYICLMVWASATPTCSIDWQKNSNQLTIQTNITPTKRSINAYYVHSPNFSTPLNLTDESDASFTVTYYDCGIYVPGKADSSADNNFVRMGFYVNMKGTSIRTEKTQYLWYGPMKSSVGSIPVGQSKSMLDNLKGFNDNDSRCLGTIMDVKNSAGQSLTCKMVNGKKFYSDEYVSVDEDGNVVALKGSASTLNYTVVTQTKYTKFKQYIDKEYNWYYLRYYDGSTYGSVDPGEANIQYGTQDWNVALTVQPTGTQATEPATTTTEKTTTTTQAPVTTQAPATYSISSNVNPSTAAKNVTLSTNTAKKGETVNVTVKDTDDAISPYVEYSYGSTTTKLAGSLSNQTRSYSFTMPEKDVSVNVYYKQLDSISVSSTKYKEGQTYSGGSTIPTQAAIAGVCSATANYKPTKSSESAETKSLPVTSSDVKFGSESITQNGTMATHTVPVTVTKTLGSNNKTGSFSFTYQYTVNIGHNVSLSVSPSSITNQTSVSPTNAASGTNIVVMTQDTDAANNPYVEITYGSTTKQLTGTLSGDVRTFTFTMPDNDVNVNVCYKTISAVDISSNQYKEGQIYDGGTSAPAPDVIARNCSATATYQANSSKDRQSTKNLTVVASDVSLGSDVVTTSGTIATHKVPVYVTKTVSSKSKTLSFVYQYQTNIGHSVSLNKVGAIDDNVTTLSTQNAAEGMTVTVTTTDSESAYNPYVEYTYGSQTRFISAASISDKKRYFTFTMPNEAVKVNVYYKTLESVVISSDEYITGIINDGGSTAPSVDTIVANCNAVANYKATKTGDKNETCNLSLTSANVSFGTETVTTSNTTATHQLPITLSKKYGGETANYKFTYKYITDIGHAIAFANIPSTVTDAASISTTYAAKGTVVTIMVKDSPSARNPYVEYICGSNSQRLTADIAEGNRTYQFVMPDQNVSLNVYYKTLQNVAISSDVYTEGNTYNAGKIAPSKSVIAANCSALASYVAQKTGESGENNTISLSESNVTLGTDSVTQSGTAKTHKIPAKVSVTYGGKTATLSFTYQYKTDDGHTITVNKYPSSVTNSVSVSAAKAEAGQTVSIITTDSETAINPYVEYVYGNTTRQANCKNVDGSNRTYAFEMPAQDVTVNVYFKTVDVSLTSGTYQSNSTYSAGSVAPDKETIAKNCSAFATYKPSKASDSAESKAIALTASHVTLGTETATQNGLYQICSVPVTVAVSYAGKTQTLKFTYQYSKDMGRTITTRSNGMNISCNTTKAIKGTKITVTVPEDTSGKYVFYKLVVTGDSNASVTSTKKSDTTYEFTMPDENVTVNAQYAVIDSIQVTPPNVTKKYSEDVAIKDLPTDGKITVKYKWNGAIVNDKDKTITMTTDMYTKGTPTKSVNGTTVTVTVPVTINVPKYGGKTGTASFSYTYTYEKTLEDHDITLEVVDEKGNAISGSNTSVSQLGAKKGTTITVMAPGKTKMAFATINVTGSDNASIGNNIGTEFSSVCTFTMPDQDVTVTVTYKTLQSIEVTKPTKTSYNKYTNVSDLDLSGGKIKAYYGSGNSASIDVDMKDSNITLSLGDETSAPKQGDSKTMVYTVPVTVTYGGQTAEFSYTYETAKMCDITLEVLPNQDSVKNSVSLSETKVMSGDTVTITLPTSIEQYAYPVVSTTSNGTTTELTEKNGIYSFIANDNTTVSVSYAELIRFDLYAPNDKNVYEKRPETYDTSKVTIDAIYKNLKTNVETRVSVPVTNDNLTVEMEEDPYTSENYNGSEEIELLKISAHVTVTYNGVSETQNPYCQYIQKKQYPITLQTSNENDTITSYSPKQISVGEEVVVSLDDTMDVISIKVNNIELTKDKYTLSNNTLTFTVASNMIKNGNLPIVIAYTPKPDTGNDDPGNDNPGNDDPDNNDPDNNDPDNNDPNTGGNNTGGDDTKQPSTPANPSTPTGTDASSNGNQNGSNAIVDNSNVTDEQKDDTTLAPMDIKNVKSSNKKITIQFAEQPNADMYEIYVSTKKGSDYVKVATVASKSAMSDISYTIKDIDGSSLKKNTKYYIKVRAVNGAVSLKKKTTIKTFKCKKNGKLSVSFKAVKNAVSYTATISLKKKKGYKKGFKCNDTGKKKYTKIIKKCGGKKVKKGKKYYVKFVTTVDNGTHQYSTYSLPSEVTCK